METPTGFTPIQLVQCGNYSACGNLAKPYVGKPRSFCNECRADHLLSRARDAVGQLGDEKLPFQAQLDQAEAAIINASSALSEAKDTGAGFREAFAAFFSPIAELREILDQAAESQRQQLLERAKEIYISSGAFEFMDRWAQVKLLCILHTLDPERYLLFQEVTWLSYEEQDQVENGRPLRYGEIARVLPNLERNRDWAKRRYGQDEQYFEQTIAQKSQPVKTSSRSGNRKR